MFADFLRWTTVLQNAYENSDFMFIIHQIRPILSVVVTLIFDVSRFPVMDDSPAKPIRKFRFQVCCMSIGSIRSIAVTFMFDASRFPTMDDNLANPLRKFRFHVLLYRKLDHCFLMSSL